MVPGVQRTLPAALCAGLVLLAACTTGSSGGGPPSSHGGPSATPPSSALPSPTASAPSSSASPDFDGDGKPDLVVGDGGRVGQVRVRYGTGTELAFGSRAITGEDHTPFGDTLLARDLNKDGYTDLVVAAATPDRSVFQIFGGPAGLDPTGADELDAPDGLLGFGIAVALVESPRPLLVIGAPGTSGGPLNGGAIVLYRLGTDGRPVGVPEVIGQGTPGVAGDPEAGDAFGSVLAATGSWLFVGVPREDLGPARDAGAVVALHFAGDGFTSTQLTQDSPAVPGEVETEDRFAQSLAAGEGYLVVGVPLEDRGKRDVGAVQPFEIVGRKLRALPPVDEAALPGAPAAGDAFGGSLAIARPCPGVAGYVAGAAAKAIGGRPLAGSVWLVPFRASGSCRARQVNEGATSPPRAAENSLYGSAVSTLRTGSGQADTLVIASVGVAEEGVPGRVLALAPPYDDAGVVVMSDLVVREEGTLTLSSPAG
jgi:hypothetical protein